MMYLFYVPHNTISLIVRDVCQAIWDEYGAQFVTIPTTAEVGKKLLYVTAAGGTFTRC